MGRDFGPAPSFYGQMSEWFKELVLKTSDAANVRGFESHSGRHVCRGFPGLYFVKIPKEKRPVLVSKPSATPKKVNVKTYNVGFVIGKSFEMQLVSGAEYQKSTATGTGRTVRPHVRRAHWHHYWVGEGRTRLEVRWIEPTFVLPEGKREIKIATVRRVMGT